MVALIAVPLMGAGLVEQGGSLPPQRVPIVQVDPSSQRSGGEFVLGGAWREFAARYGLVTAQAFATHAVDLAARLAGNPQLDAAARRHFIQLVLAGDGGINPDEAADVMELNLEVVSDDNQQLAKLAEAIRARYSNDFRRQPPEQTSEAAIGQESGPRDRQ